MIALAGLDLTDRLVVCVGAGSVAERRIARLRAAGARVRLVAPVATERLSALAASGAIEWHARPFAASDLDDAWFCHTATGDAAIDAVVVDAAEERRVWCVNAGHGGRGTARLAAETTSGDVMVGVVSTAGADPRRTVAVRDAIAQRLAEGALPLRRRRRPLVGSVALVGGGPGPIDLMTVRARALLAEADVVVHDRLGPTGVLAELGDDVELVDVGKRPQHHPVPQDEINAIIVDRAAKGLRVVRLKGGDPFVYGRGGEEVIACRAAGIPVEVVPGISSAVAVPAAAGVPVTHRGVAGTLHVVNGQDAPSEATLAALRDDTATVVALMGVSALARFVSAARAAGAPETRPVAFVENGHTPQQRTIRTTLGTAIQDAETHRLANPAVLVFGEVARADLLLPAAAVPVAAAHGEGIG
ncbi:MULTISPECIES: uroporphyrinogen-III C-methyltransferase [unclassified Microbacterium]|uniref:uroporphyrinogen-III C-methyltransferase n=1 Tax=unclassified Microbacterium TaxID=2609290 RepID=UPI0017821B16|nr:MULTISPECIES: uroporphyrinogen-III C-methyltransferase [unclassified Microbacterium]MBD8206438.1 uroporphyrinogen-III C-methyltransferase [Microbacterium sp. CFBP 8801]MBD8478360.1 uroporphyrinogen-III C-methyltransferase [Microbacterium sp. CFBP 8794]MBD8508366.1 uroporphyrinogen-III C-methyltransferase [Microbacterium sp. CFBP 8790]